MIILYNDLDLAISFPRWKRIPGRIFNFEAALDAAPTLDNYEGDFEGLFSFRDDSAATLDAKFNRALSEVHFDASLDQCARMCFSASGRFSKCTWLL